MSTTPKEVLRKIEAAKKENSTELDLSECKLRLFPQEILELTNLTGLELSHNQLTVLPEAIEKLTKLTKLNLDNNELTIIPETIGKLTNLTNLEIGNNELTIFSEAIGKLTNLKYLDLRGNQLTTLPEAIGNLTKLTMLNIHDNKLLVTYPEAIGKLTNLIGLYFGGTQLTKVPETIGKLTNLTELNLSYNQLTVFPEAINKLTQLTQLTLQGNQLTKVPETIGKLTNLTELNLSYNQLTVFPEAINKLTKLTYLDLSYNQLTVFSEAINKLTKLTQLGLHGNQLTVFPEAINKLTKLTQLGLQGNQLTKVPETIGKLTNLTELSLGGNQLTIVPETIGKLTNLTGLSLGGNQLAKVPEAIRNLTNLTTLYLWGNQLTTLPEAIGKLTNLKQLNLSGNKFKVGAEVYKLPPKEQIQEILKWQRAQQAGTLQPIHEAKIIFIGESNYGKTHLIEFLQNGEIKRKITTTHGIERNQLAIPYNDKEIRLNIWDLGGQEFMRSTHQFFFSERTLYVLVTLARRERNELNHWLKLANQLGNKAPVLVVINKIDADPHDLDRRSLERDYPNIIGFVRTCIYDCKDGSVKAADTIEQLKKKIIATVSDKDLMPGVFEQRKPEWFTVKKELEKLETKGIDFITYKEYEKLEFVKNLPEDERKSNLKLLSMIGAVVSYVDDPRLIDTNVINPQWIMDGVYTIINDPKVKDEAKGELHIDDLERILPKKDFPKDRHAYLLQLMEKFNLCYAARDQRDIYFIPDLFEDIEPDFDWDGDNSMHFRYNYDDFPPDAFMTRFLVEMYLDIEDEKRWRSGVYISNGSCQAKVYQTFRKNYIHIEVLGNKGEGRSYLYTIRDTFRKLHKPFPNMPIKQEVLYKGHWLNYELLSKLEDKNKPFYHVELDEDLPITDILNGYSSMKERQGDLKIIQLFLASSFELKAEREQFEIFINRENNILIEKGIFIKVRLWEDFIDAMSQTRLQDEYNHVVEHSDIFISLFFTKVGKYTLEEFETAFGQFKKTGKPLVYTYFKNAPIDAEDITDEFQSRLDFQKRLKELGHYRTTYKNIDDLKFQFKKQLEKILPKL